MLKNIWGDLVESYDDGLYFGDNNNNDYKRGFFVKNDGSWVTSYFHNNELHGASIDGKHCLFINNKNNFMNTFLNAEDNFLNTTIVWRGKEIELTIDFNEHRWTYTNMNNPSKQIYYDPETRILYKYDGNKDEETVLNYISDKLLLSGKVEWPLPVKVPKRTYHHTDEKLEYIYSDTYDDLIMLAERGTSYKWYGEGKYVTPGGFGIKTFKSGDRNVFEYGLFKSFNLGVPYLEYENRVYLEYSGCHSDVYDYFYIKPYNGSTVEVCFILKRSGEVVFILSNNYNDSVRICEDENVIEITTDGKKEVFRFI